MRKMKKTIAYILAMTMVTSTFVEYPVMVNAEETSIIESDSTEETLIIDSMDASENINDQDINNSEEQDTEEQNLDSEKNDEESDDLTDSYVETIEDSTEDDLTGTVEVTDITEMQSAHNYADNTDKTWVYTEENVGAYNVTFSTDTELENGADYIYIYDKDDNQIARYTGTSAAGKTVNVPGDTFKIRLVTDSSTEAWGFALDSIAKMTAIEVNQDPTLIRYLLDQTVSYDGLKIVGDYDDGTQSEITDYTIDDSELDNTAVGDYNVKVNYYDLSTSFVISYIDPTIEKLEITTNPTTTTVPQNCDYDLSGMVLTATDSEGTTHTITEGYEVSGFDSSSVGENEITISYKGAEVKLTLTIVDTYIYTVSGSNVTITGLNDKNIENLIIPEEINGNKVTSIAANAFSGYSGIKKIVVPDTVTSIESGAFKGTSVEELTVPFIGTSASATGYTGVLGYIFGYTKTYGSVTGGTLQYSSGSYYYYYYIPSTLKKLTVTDAEEIGENAFENCVNLEKVSLNEEIASIGSSAFYNCTNLQSVNIPEKITSIPSSCFYNCTSLKKMAMPDGISIINSSAFSGCSSIEQMNIPDSLETIGQYAFSGCAKVNDFIELELPDGVTVINEYAFNGCSQVEKINVPDTVTSIGSGVFKGTSVEELIVPFIGTSASATGYEGVLGYIFGYTTSNSSVTGGTDQYNYYGSYDYYYYIPSTLKKVTVTDAEKVGTNAFKNCVNLETIILNEGITSIGTYAFYNCDNCTIYLPDSAETISSNALYQSTGNTIYCNKDTAAYTFASQYASKVYSTDKVTLDFTEKTLYKDETSTLTATVSMLNGKVDTSPSLTWSSSDTSVVTVDSTGNITVTGPGSAEVSACCEGKTATCMVTVYYKLTSIELSETLKDIDIGESIQLTVSYDPVNTTDDKTITWTSTDPTVALVSTSGKVTALKRGTTNIVAAASNGLTKLCKINVLVPATSINLDQESMTIEKGKSATLSASLLPADYTDTYSWTSSDEQIATVDDEGNVTAVSSGDCSITATTKRGLKASCLVTVIAHVESISFERDSIDAVYGHTYNLAPVISPSDYTDIITWSSDNSDAVTVDDEGNINVISNTGTAVITATSENGMEAHYNVNIVNDISEADIIYDETASYTGKEIKPDVKVILSGTELTQDVDYEVSYTDNTVIGTARITVTGISNCTGTIAKTFTINKCDLNNAQVSCSDITDSYTYSGSQNTPAVSLTNGSVTMSEGTDYTVEYKDNIDAGQAKIIITGIGNYEGSIERTFTIDKADISTASATVSALKYTGTSQVADPVVTFNSKKLTAGTDYISDITSQTNIGTYDYILTGTGNFTGTLTGDYVINAAEANDLSYALSCQSYTYTGSEFKPTVTVKYGSITLASSRDYDIAYSNNTNAGTANVLVTLKGNYKGTKQLKFTINKCNLSTITLAKGFYSYTGKAIKPTMAITGKNSRMLSTSDYNVSYVSNTKVGTASVTVSGKGNYQGTLKKTFNIIPYVKASKATLYVLQTYSLGAKSSSKITYKSSNSKVATVNAKGTVTAKKAGTAKITVTSNKKSVTVTISVKSLSLNKKSLSFYGNEVETLKVIKTSKKIKWSSSNSKIAKVSSKGKVTGVNVGKATISAKIGNITLKCTVKVHGEIDYYYYKKIKKGMSYSAVKKMMGVSGELKYSSGKTKWYQWADIEYGDSDEFGDYDTYYTYIDVWFNNGKAYSKTYDSY